MLPQYLSRNSLLFECKMAHEAIDLMYFARRMGILVLFITSAFNHQVDESSITTAVVVWFVLSIIFRPRIVYALRGTRIAEIIGLFQLPLRWIVFLICGGYLWYVDLTTSSMWWWLLGAFLLDTAATFILERPKFLDVEKRIAYLKTQPSIIVVEGTE